MAGRLAEMGMTVATDFDADLFASYEGAADGVGDIDGEKIRWVGEFLSPEYEKREARGCDGVVGRTTCAG